MLGLLVGCLAAVWCAVCACSVALLRQGGAGHAAIPGRVASMRTRRVAADDACQVAGDGKAGRASVLRALPGCRVTEGVRGSAMTVALGAGGGHDSREGRAVPADDARCGKRGEAVWEALRSRPGTRGAAWGNGRICAWVKRRRWRG